MKCPQCGHSTVDTLEATSSDPFEAEIHRVGSVRFDRPVTVTRSGLYIVGANEDGVPILTRVEGES